jgi:hypothetical protein
MAYATGVPTSPINLLQQLVTFLSANGWTSDKSASVGSGWEAHLHKGGMYAHLRAAVGEGPWVSQADAGGTALLLYLSDGFNNSAAWNLQPTVAPFASGTTDRVGVGMNLSAGPFSNYYFFTDSGNDNVVVVVEKTPGLYVHLAWGLSLNKNGTWTGGMYFTGSSSGYYAGYRSFGPNNPGFTSSSPCPGSHQDLNGFAAGFVLCDVDTFTGKWIGISDTTLGAGGFTGRGGASSVHASAQLNGGSTITGSIPRYATAVDALSATAHQFQFMQTSVIDGRANLLPVIWWVGRDGSSGQSGGFSPIGTLPMVFFSNGVGNGFVPASEYLIGSDTYKMFPNFAVLKV